MGQALVPDLNAAFITVIPKPDKNSEEVGNYKPISLINNDVKILTKILANRLNSFISSYIHKDQVGFMPGRQGPDQTRRAIDIISVLQSNWPGGQRQQGMLLSLDILKAFDSVSWPYIFALLERWGFGSHFVGILRALYSSPTARIRVQELYSPPVQIARGTRQGCPLSPLIFAMATETLAIAIRENPDVKGVACGPQTHKCGLFADDLILFISSPLTSIPNLNKILSSFGSNSGLIVNFSKSLALNVSLSPEMVTLLKQNFQFV